jgi:hypothetical protein
MPGWMDRSITEGIGTTLYGACILHSACGFLLVYERNEAQRFSLFTGVFSFRKSNKFFHLTIHYREHSIPNIYYKGEDIASDWA